MVGEKGKKSKERKDKLSKQNRRGEPIQQKPTKNTPHTFT